MACRVAGLVPIKYLCRDIGCAEDGDEFDADVFLFFSLTLRGHFGGNKTLHRSSRRSNRCSNLMSEAAGA